MSDTSARTPVTADAAAFQEARGEQQAKPRTATPRLRRDEPTSKAAARRLVPASSAFDLLDGEYAKNRKSRVLSVISLGVAGLVVLTLLAQFLRLELEISNQRQRYDNAAAAGRTNKAELDKLSQFEGVPGDLVSEALQGRSRQAAAATETELDLAAIINDLTSIVPAGVRLTQIQVSAPAEEDGKRTKEKEDEDSTTAAPSAPAIITVLADVESYKAITPFLQQMRASATLSDFQETWTGEPPMLKLRIDIKVATGGSARFAGFTQDAGLDDGAAASTPEGGS